MKRDRGCWQRRGFGRTSGLVSAFLAFCLLLVGVLLVGYWAGWIEFDRDELRQKTTIEVNTGKVEKAAEGAAVEGKELIEKAGERLENLKQHDTLTPLESSSRPEAGGAP